MTPREHIALMLAMQNALKILGAHPAVQNCANCSNMLPRDGGVRFCSKYNDNIPPHHTGTDCAAWSEEIPF